MPKHLITPLLALVLSFSAHAQLQFGLAADYEHVQATNYYNIGPGSGYGGSVFFHAPFAPHWGVDWSLDLAAGHTQSYYENWSPAAGFATMPTSVTQNRSFFYTGIPVHFVYSYAFPKVRVFAGPGLAYIRLHENKESFHGFSLDPDCSALMGSVKAGGQLYEHFVISGEFRFLKAYLSKDNNRISNMLSLKLGYAFGAARTSVKK